MTSSPFVQVERFDLHGMVLVPINQNSEHKEYQWRDEEEYLAECRYADTEDEYGAENEKQTDCTSTGM